MPSSLAIDTTVRLCSGYELPLLGLDVYMNDDAKPACVAALKAGYHHIDSARMYRNEAQVGETVRESGIPRNQVYINGYLELYHDATRRTKLTLQRQTSKLGNNEHGYDNTLAAVDDSLKSFGFDYLDFMLIHGAKSDKPTRLATWKALVDSEAAGKIRCIGISNYAVKHLEDEDMRQLVSMSVMLENAQCIRLVIE